MTLITLICANKTKVNTFLNFADVVWVNNLANLKTFKILVDPWYPQKFRFEWLRQWLRDKWQTASFSFILNLRKQDIKTIDKSAKLALNYPKKALKYLFYWIISCSQTLFSLQLQNYWTLSLIIDEILSCFWFYTAIVYGAAFFCCNNSFKGTYINTN